MNTWIRDNQTGLWVQAELTPIADRHVATINATWVPEFRRRQDAGAGDQDFLMWKTGLKYGDQLTYQPGVQTYVVQLRDEIHGVLALQCTPERSRLSPDNTVMIVRYVATAPWNRPGPSTSGKFKQVGTALLGQAVLDSIAAECQGRLGLHSLSDSDRFYRKMGFVDVGPDPAQRGLRYFELPVPAAAQLLQRCTHTDRDA